MPKFKVSQGEKWHRTYEIEADNLAAAKALYERFISGRPLAAEDADKIYDNLPEYLEDLEDDIEWYEE